MPEPRDAHDCRDAGGRAKQDARAEERRMYRMYGQVIAPALPALPPSLAVVCRGCRDAQDVRYAVGGMNAEERRMHSTINNHPATTHAVTPSRAANIV
ncbi:MAG: hypothetical protein ABW078_04605 [Sedimenticola sp.]